MSKSLITLDQIASDIIGDLEDSGLKHKFKITRHLIDGYSEMNIFICQNFDVKTEVLDFDNSINLPCDFVYETKVGVLHNGRLAVLTLDPNVKYGKKNDSDTQKYLSDIWYGDFGGPGYWFYNAYRAGNYLGELYGLGRGVWNEGTYSIDKTNGVINIGSHIPPDAEIVIEYKSDGVSDNGLKLVPREMKRALTFYAKYMWYADRNVTQSQINENRYKRAYNKLQRLYNFRSALYMADKINEMFSPSNY